MTSPTPPSRATGAGAQHATQAAGAESALAFVDQLDDYVAGLKRELRGYGDPNTVGRDTAQLSSFFENIHRCEIQIAQSMGVDWNPANWKSSPT